MRVLFLLVVATLVLPFCAGELAQIETDSVVPVSDMHFLSYRVEPTEPEPEHGVRSWSHLPSRSEQSGVTDQERDVLMSVSADYDVNSGLLYGIWSMESARLGDGWSNSWPLAKRMRLYGSECAKRYRIIKCRRRWKAVQRICAQKRGDQPICNPNQVHCSRAIALGSMQHLSTRWSPAEGEWGEHVRDYDEDGVYDPHRLTDAMASAAMHLRNDYSAFRKRGSSEHNAWRLAVRMYLGCKTACRYERGVYRYKRNWCSLPGYCD